MRDVGLVTALTQTYRTTLDDAVLTSCPQIAGPDHGPPDDLFLIDLNDLTAVSNYMWLTPDNCDDMHGAPSCPPRSITTADNYAAQLIPRILNSSVSKTHQAALFIIWDEASYCTTSSQIPAIWIGPIIKQGYLSNYHYNHYSYLKIIETLWTLPSLQTFDTTATPMTEFFR